MLLPMEKDKGLLQILDNIQIEASDFEWFAHQSYPLPVNSETCISETEVRLFSEHPRLLLQICTMHFHKFLYHRTAGGTSIVERMFFSEDEIDSVWGLSKQVFQNPILFKGRTRSDNQIVYRVDAKELTPTGDVLLKVLDVKGLIPDIWRKLYLSGRFPPIETEGIYYFDSFPAAQETHAKNSMDKLLTDPYFRSMDISNISLANCERNADMQKLLSNCREAVIFVEEHKGQYLKRLCWKWKDKGSWYAVDKGIFSNQ